VIEPEAFDLRLDLNSDTQLAGFPEGEFVTGGFLTVE
jgi:hypothetical protein